MSQLFPIKLIEELKRYGLRTSSHLPFERLQESASIRANLLTSLD
jgi:hypothetical protein